MSLFWSVDAWVDSHRVLLLGASGLGTLGAVVVASLRGGMDLSDAVDYMNAHPENRAGIDPENGTGGLSELDPEVAQHLAPGDVELRPDWMDRG